MLNLYLAIIWFGAGIALFFLVDQGAPATRSFPMPFSGLAALLCMYNLVRWWGWRTMRANRKAGDAAYSQWRPRFRRPDDSEANPELRFTDSPPPSGADPSRLKPGTNGNGEADRHS